ncbi:hypothetical protein D9M68_911660 [compost metagenome]
MLSPIPFDDLQAQWAPPDIMRFAAPIEALGLPFLGQEPRLLPPHPCHSCQDSTPDSIQAHGRRSGNADAAIRWVDANVQVLDAFPMHLDIDAADHMVLSIHYGSSKLP